MNGTSGGPPKGSVGDSRYAENIPADQAGKDLAKLIGANAVPPYDPAMANVTGTLGPDTAKNTRVVYRDLPLVTVQNQWTVQQTISALASHMIGIFERSSQLVDAMLGDDRVQATLGSRVSGLFGHEPRFKPANGSKEARECARAWKKHWPLLASASAMHTIHTYGLFMGFSPGQLLWDTAGDRWMPYLRPWHPRYTYYHWTARRYIALTQDGQAAITPGDGKWLLHAPYGEYRSWIRGAVRSVAEPWLIRHFAYRDWARFSEVHGMPIRKGIVPAASEEASRDRYQQQLSNLGSETTIMVAQGVDGKDGGNAYDLELVEARDTAWESFPGLIDRCDMSIVLALLFQNLTTEVKGGSFAATTAHMDIRQSGIQFDNAAWKLTIYNQIARPFAYLNFGDADLAPWTDYEVQPLQDYDQLATLLAKFGTAIEVMRRGGVQFANERDVRKLARTMGLTLPKVKLVDPVGGGMGAGGGGGA